MSAYFGFIKESNPKAGEVVVVSGAAGAVGSIVLQLAKLSGCKTIGIAGSEEKLKFLLEIGADAVINYKVHNDMKSMQKAILQAIGSFCPDKNESQRKVDNYFDNVGGFTSDAIYPILNLRARIIICGQISQYQGKIDAPELGPRFLHHIFYQRATIKGILGDDYIDRMPEMVTQMCQWIKEGKIKVKETVVEGFEKLPTALESLFHGENTGKLVVKVGDPSK